nr:MAG TPA: hypothetical protein [Caudoviricetes sp.]
MCLSIIDKCTTFWCYFIEAIKWLRTFLCILEEESIVYKKS